MTRYHRRMPPGPPRTITPEDVILAMDEEEKTQILIHIAEVLYWDSDADEWDFEKEWDVDFLDDIAAVMRMEKVILP